MIEFRRVSFTFPDADAPTLVDVDLEVTEGELALVVGATGTGKSTLLRAVNGLVPRFTGGTLRGEVRVAGRSTSELAVEDLAGIVGYVPQDPATGFVTDSVEEELAYTMEQLGLGPSVMRKRVEEVLDLLGLAPLRDRSLNTLSGGEAQRVAIGSVFTAHPRILVLDEPTSALDPAAAEEVLAAVTRLVHDLGVTVFMAEHRLERVVQYADTVVHLSSEGHVTSGEPKTVMETSTTAPPVVQLGRLAGWSPLPLSVRDARRMAGDLADRLPQLPPRATAERSPTVSVEGVTVAYAGRVVVKEISFRLGRGEVAALMGRNGAGKSSLLWAIQGSGTRSRGQVRVDGVEPAGLDPAAAREIVALVPHQPADLLFTESVAEEAARADRSLGLQAGTTLARAEELIGSLDAHAHPSDLSEGQKLALVLAIQLGAHPRLVLLDEPTRGLDYDAKRHLATAITRLSAEGAAVIVATHDVEFAAEVSETVMVMADGDLVAAGPTREVVTASPVFAPQVAKILGDGWLTVTDVATALEKT